METNKNLEESKWDNFQFNPDTVQKGQVVSSPSPSKSKSQTKFEKLQAQVDPVIKEKWEKEQYALKQQLKEYDDFEFTFDPQNVQASTLRLIGAIDISYSKTDDKKAVAALIICEYPSFRILYSDFEQETADYPYIPGFLAFKEIPVYTILFNKLKQNHPEFWPQVLLVDGNGVLHTRGFGCASHIGVLMDIPSIGVGKTVFAVDGLTQLGVKKDCEQKLLKGGDLIDLVGNSGKVWGAALRSTSDSKNPIIISVGTRVSLKTAIEIVKACILKYRIPEPIRHADLKSRELVKNPTDIFNYFQNDVLEKRNSQDDDAEGILAKRDDLSPKSKNEQKQQNVINLSMTTSPLSSKNIDEDPLLKGSEQTQSQTDKSDATYQLYPYRFINLMLYCFTAALNQIAWISMQPIAPAAQKAYKIDETTVNTISLVYMGVYVLINFPSIYALDKYGARIGVTIGTIFTGVGMIIKCFINYGFWIVIFGQVFAAIGQPFLANAPAKLVAQWYSKDGRVVATTIAATAMPLGAAIGFIIPVLYVSPEIETTSIEDLQYQIFLSLITQAIIGVVVTILVTIFLREKPPTPPSATTETVHRGEFFENMKIVFSNVNLLKQVLVFACLLSVVNTLGTMVSQIGKQFNYDSDDSSVFGALFIIGGLSGSAAFGIFVEKTKKFKLVINMIALFSIILGILVMMSFTWSIMWITTILCFLIGFSMIPIMPIGFEFGVEISYPVDEAFSTGLQMCSGQILGIVLTLSGSLLVKNMQKTGAMISMGSYVVFCVFAFLMSLFLKQDLRRLKSESSKATRESYSRKSIPGN